MPGKISKYRPEVDYSTILQGGSYDEDGQGYYNDETDKMDYRKLKVECPNCERLFAALFSPYLIVRGSSWVWRGDSHKEPETEFAVLCVGCNHWFIFRVYVGQ